MDAEMLSQLIPIVAIVMTMGLPLGIVFVNRHFKFKHRELEAELEARKLLSERDRVELEKRIERLESVIMGGARAQAPGADANARFTNVAGPALQTAPERAGLYEGPATSSSSEPSVLPPLREKA